MSQQEELLEPEPAIEMSKPQKGEDRISWFRRSFPGFFTEKVVANRESGFVLISPRPSKQQHWQPVTRKLESKRTTHIALHRNLEDNSFYFKCPCVNVALPIERNTLMTAIALVHGSEWVHVRVGTDIFQLNRAELRVAVQKLSVK